MQCDESGFATYKILPYLRYSHSRALEALLANRKAGSSDPFPNLGRDAPIYGAGVKPLWVG
jgi:hypothetical protein